MSQDELSEKLDVTRQSVSLWENDQTQPSLDNIIALSKLFGVTTDELLSNDSDEKPVPADFSGSTESANARRRLSKKSIGLICGISVGVLLLVLILVLTLWGCGA